MPASRIFGIDFTSAPRRAKPITIASARLAAGRLRVERILLAPAFDDFEAFLATPGP